jgi:peptide chain release factor 2
MISDEVKRDIEKIIFRINKSLDYDWLKEKQDILKAVEVDYSSENFWKREDAKEKIKLLSFTKKEIGKFNEIKKLKEDIEAMRELYEETSEIMDVEAAKIVKDAEKKVKSLEIERYLSDPYDDLNAFLSFSSGAGGVDAQDWTEMLLKMYLKWAEKKNFETRLLNEAIGEEAGIKSATVHVKGEFAYGFLKVEAGVHRLVRISPFDANKRRHTSFALVEVIPELAEIEDIEIDEKDLRIDIFRASGHGGQNVQKVETAVRITHIPTGITSECQDERSQSQNKLMAMKVLKSRLLVLAKKKKNETIKEIKGEFKSAEWGNEIRSYVLQPYQLVKDHRTNYETGRIGNVLEGEIDEFIWAYLKNQK